MLAVEGVRAPFSQAGGDVVGPDELEFCGMVMGGGMEAAAMV